jgi:hypothetical protein
MEDTSDAYYTALHRRYEVFERRQRIREKEKLQFERYKMRSRIDLLRNMSIPAWTAVVTTVLSRTPIVETSSIDKTTEESVLDAWAKGREKIKLEGMDWLRNKLVREGEEVMKRYDQLLPSEPKRSVIPSFSPAHC